jgi:hypothetical protein
MLLLSIIYYKKNKTNKNKKQNKTIIKNKIREKKQKNSTKPQKLKQQ